jgi:hypothetical protein
MTEFLFFQTEPNALLLVGRDEPAHDRPCSDFEIQQLLEDFVSDFEDINRSNVVVQHHGYEKYCVKELLKITQYYNLSFTKCKKQNIIDSIVCFETNPENTDIVQKRLRLWGYMNEISNDPKMKMYVVWKSI